MVVLYLVVLKNHMLAKIIKKTPVCVVYGCVQVFVCEVNMHVYACVEFRGGCQVFAPVILHLI